MRMELYHLLNYVFVICIVVIVQPECRVLDINLFISSPEVLPEGREPVKSGESISVSSVADLYGGLYSLT